MRRPRPPFLRAQAAQDPKPQANVGWKPAQVRKSGAGDWVIGDSDILVTSPGVNPVTSNPGMNFQYVPTHTTTASFMASNLVGVKG